MQVTNNMSDKQANIVKSNCYMTMGNICTMLKALNYAITYYTNAIELLKEQNRTKKLISCYKSRRKAYLLIGEKEKADNDLKIITKIKLKSKSTTITITF